MDARCRRSLYVFLSVLFVLPAPFARGATYKTRNFTVTAESPEVAKQVGDAAEVYRRELAVDWLGRELPPWFAPCPVYVKVGTIGAGGATTFSFQPQAGAPAEVGSWDMKIQGSLERILDSVLPHEICHTIFACYFRRPLPRWADEGAATLIEHESERRRQVDTVSQVIRTARRIPLRKLFSLKEYPTDMRDVMTLYAEGYSLAELLVQQGGKARYLAFLNDANESGWDKAVKAHYGYRDVDELEKRWQEWVQAGSQPLKLPEGQLLARNDKAVKPAAHDGYVIRGQSEEATRSNIRDPFLTQTVMFETPAENDKSPAKTKPLPLARTRSDGGKSSRPRNPSREELKNDSADWVAEEDAADRQLASKTRKAKDEEEGWVDAPRPKAKRTGGKPRTSAERSLADRSPPSNRNDAKPQSLETEPAVAKSLPSSVRQRQTADADELSEPRELASRSGRTTWSEFPEESRPSPLVFSGSGR